MNKFSVHDTLKAEWKINMDISIRKLFDETLDWNLTGIIISNSTDKEKVSKVKLRPVLIKEELQFQATEYIGPKVFHSNYTKMNLLDKLPDWFDGLFHQAEITTKKGTATILVSKNKKATINNKIMKSDKKETISLEDNKNRELRNEEVSHQKDALLQKEALLLNEELFQKESLLLNDELFQKEALLQNVALQHNKKKNYILKEGTPLPFLIDLGVMTKEGAIVKAKTDKFRQINRFLEFIEDILPYLEKDRELTILDFGCGKSYLTFAMYYYLRILQGYRINVIGLDLKKDVIEQCNCLSEKYGYDKLHFLVGDIASYTGSSSVDMVVTLHACDTATDHALSKAVAWGAKVILSVPCCQHELNKQMSCETLKPVIKYGIIKERMAALVTDALRAELLEAEGYRVQLLEFIDMEHTPKNILIRAVKRSKTGRDKGGVSKELSDCMDFFGVNPTLHQLLRENRQDS
jgi:SAM-dependent methyltransferase